MKLKQALSVLLAAVLASALACAPAAASSLRPDLAEVERILDTADQRWQDIYPSVELTRHDVPVKLLRHEWGDTGAAKGAAAEDYTLSTVTYLPLGVTITVGPDYEYCTLFAYSDPDGDGVFEERMERDVWLEDGGYRSEIVPLSEPGPFVGSDEVDYANYFAWGEGIDRLEWGIGTLGGYRSLTTDWLVELFGADTILEFTNGEYSGGWIYLTGKARAEGPDVNRRLENYGIAVGAQGWLTSAWAGEAADEAYALSMLPLSVEDSHRCDLRGKITRGEFAAIAVELYRVMGGTYGLQPAGPSPFSDVQSDNSNYAYILEAYRLGIVKGLPGGRFGPDTLVSREQAAVMLARVYETLGGTIPAVPATTFVDDGDISSYARDAVAFLSARGIVNGVGGGRFSPKGDASVEQALKIAVEMYRKLA